MKMANSKIIAFFLFLTIISSCFFINASGESTVTETQFPMGSENEIEVFDESETFIEHDYLTNTDTVFTYNEAMANSSLPESDKSSNTMIMEPYNLPSSTVGISGSDTGNNTDVIIDPDNYNYVQDVYQSPYC